MTTAFLSYTLIVSPRREAMSNRRTFLKQTTAIGGALGLSPLAVQSLEGNTKH